MLNPRGRFYHIFQLLPATVALILNLLANNASIEEILDDYPELQHEDITACFKYAEWTTSEKTITSVAE